MVKPSGSAGIIDILTRLCGEIRAPETEYGLIIGKGDMRPRIEYFHDAVRAFSANDQTAMQKGGRLTVEFLAYDVAMLRYLQAHPLSPLSPGHANLSPHTEIINPAPQAVGNVRPNRETKQQLQDGYKQYGVLFSALLKPMADRDYKDRVEEMSEDIARTSAALNSIEQLGQGKGNAAQAMQAATHLDNASLQALVTACIKQQKYKNAGDLSKIIRALKTQLQASEKESKSIEDAHLQYATGQLGLYEEGKEMIKQLAAHGMNLAGQFVENSMRQAAREMGR